MSFRLGKLPSRHDSRTLQLANYLRVTDTSSSRCSFSCRSEGRSRPEESRLVAFAEEQGTEHRQKTALALPRALAPAPHSVDWTAKIPSWPMFSNDTIGDCTTAAAAHMIQCWTANAGDAFTPTNAQVIAAYSAAGHYIPGDAATDNGAVELDVLNFWRQQGIAGHKIAAYVSFAAQNFEHARQAINLFGGIYIGLALPLSAQNQDAWETPSFLARIFHYAGDSANTDPGSWGGHAVPVLAYDSDTLTCITWGAKKRMTWEFFARYCDESYAPLSRDWLNARGKGPEGLDLDALQADLSEIEETPHIPAVSATGSIKSGSGCS